MGRKSKNAIFCVACKKHIQPQRCTGETVYPNRPDLYAKQFFVCPYCGNYVGAHADGRPLGTIPTLELRRARIMVHSLIDGYWLPTRDTNKRRELYAAISNHIGKEYHTGELNSIDECNKVIKFYREHFGK